ncbi:hypothetical protein THMIRHAT_22740 [Thiosulfativibrio zosterae]|uniref:Lcl C-terminal domain-containing protein n=2 Tax=Thiosulfativibrio zosterae TaxID=2675053 RepID=A0A6F8PR74_9GAMM|nr:hypothetical protein THMIRHAT_22740 [Thiosulfativibrio zosterae]
MKSRFKQQLLSGLLALAFSQPIWAGYDEGRIAFKNKDYALAVKEWTLSARQGDQRSQNALGLMYKSGRGVTKDLEKAAYWYTKAAEQGSGVAQSNLGEMYADGKGVTQDYKKAAYWYTKAAEQGDVKTQKILGLMYLDGEGVTQDYKKAVYWFTKAAEKGDASAQNTIGGMYAEGYGVTQDSKKAVEWYIKAAEQGNATAQNNLELMFKAGQFDKKAYEEERIAKQKAYEEEKQKADAENKILLAKQGYIDNQDGTITDTKTNLTWMRCSLGQTWTGSSCSGEAKSFDEWKTAINWGKNTTYAGKSDWRLPTVEELHSLVYCSSGQQREFRMADDGRNRFAHQDGEWLDGRCEGNFQAPTIFSTAFPNTPNVGGLISVFYLTVSSFLERNKENGRVVYRALVSFDSGEPYEMIYASDYVWKFVRLVRGGEQQSSKTPKK